MTGVVEAGWLAYRARVVPSNVAPVYVQSLKHCYYASAAHLVERLQGLGADDVSEDTGVAVLESVQAELRGFLADVLGGEK